MALLLSFLISLAIGTIAMWFIGMFSPDPPPISHSFIGVFIIETLSIPFSYLGGLGTILIMVTAIVVMVTIIGMRGAPAFFAAMLYVVIKIVLPFFFLSALIA